MNCKKLAEVEINKFFYDGRMIDRVMIVLRSNGCEHYKKTGGCSMCSHFNGTPINGVVTTENYIKQWDSIIGGSQFETYVDFNLNDYPVVCIYNLGSFFNENEISKEAARYIFSNLNNYKNVEKAIVESRAEYVTDDAISNIKSVYDNIIEVGIGVESTNMTIRELCHHKGIEDMSIYKKAVDTLHVHGCKALAYVVLQFDAHGDYLGEFEECLHGSVMKRINMLPNVKKIVHCGLRGNLNTGGGLRESVENGNVIILKEDLNYDAIKKILMKAIMYI